MNKAEVARNFYHSDEFTQTDDIKTLKKYARDLVNESKRLYKEELKGEYSPAQAYLRYHTSRYVESLTGKKDKRVVLTIPKETQTPKQYRDLIRIHSAFQEKDTSTKEKYLEYKEKVARTLSSEGFDYNSLTNSQKKRFWELYNEAVKDDSVGSRWLDPDLYDSEQRAKTIAEVIKKRNPGGKFRSHDEQLFDLLAQISPE